MKTLLAIILGLIALVVCALVFYKYGGSALNNRYRIAEYEFQIPKDAPPMLAENLVLRGVVEALQTNRFDVTNWIPIRRESDGAILRIGKNTNSASITLTNQTHRGYLFAHVELEATNRILKIVLSRSK